MMNSFPLFLISILFFIIISIPPPSFAQKPHALVTPVTKDPSTLQYIAKVRQRTPLIPLKLAVDLGARYLWVDCERGYVSSTYRPVRCGDAQCSAASSLGCGDCFSKPRPGCNNNTCGATPENPFIRTSTPGELATDVFSLTSTDGSRSGPAATASRFLFSCGPTSLLKGLARGTTGVIALGRTKASPPEQLAAAFSFQRAFAICLSGSSTGYMFFGNGPFVFLPGIDVSSSLSYTPLIVNPVSTAGVSVSGEKSAEYFIGVTSINVNEKPVKLNQTLLKINGKGVGGTKISTVHPYTLLESSIYRALLRAFSTALSQVKRVAPVAPFGLCFDANSLGSTRVGPGVPAIDLVLQSSAAITWRIFGANSMVRVNDNALCLGFIAAGPNPTTSVVIGGHQLEDNFLLFDLARSRLGFSSTLLSRQTTCANFNYTA